MTPPSALSKGDEQGALGDIEDRGEDINDRRKREHSKYRSPIFGPSRTRFAASMNETALRRRVLSPAEATRPLRYRLPG